MRLACLTVAVVLINRWSSGPASARDIIRCTAKGKPDITMVLNGERKLGRLVSCISGEFVADMTPCAPNGGFGLSYPTGTASLARIVDRWQDYGNHMGGITGHHADATRVHFDGGYFSPGDSKTPSRWSDQWSFTANRLTGEAKLTEDGKPDTVYACSKASARF